MTKHLLQIVACYVIGIVIGNLVLVPLFGELVIALIPGGILLGLPILLVALLVFALMKNQILPRLLLWCLATPFLAVLVWLTLEWQFNYSNRGHDLSWYLSLRNVWERASLCFTCAGIGTAFFWYWNRNPEIA
jgi:hypothetical protein